MIEVFKYIEESKEEFGIEDCTIASTSLEDVFLKINNKSNLNNMKYVNQEENNSINNQENIIIPENLNEKVKFGTQLISQLHRIFISIKRNKILILLEYIAGLGITYILFLVYISLMNEMINQKLNLIELLEDNSIYYYEPDSMESYLKNSYVYDSSYYITLKKLSSEPKDLKHLINISYDESFAHIAEASVSLKKDKNNNIIAYASQINRGYLYANSMFIISAFLKNEYNIDATIFSKIEFRRKNNGQNEHHNIIIVLAYVGIGTSFGYIIYLGGLINEKIIERKTNIKHLLYLSGSNPLSY